jgi:hypothetical protein
MFMKLMGHRSKASNVVNTKVVGPIHRFETTNQQLRIWLYPQVCEHPGLCRKNPGILKPANIVVMNSCDTPFKITPKGGFYSSPS